jgi:hypothetical protein
MTKRLFLYPSLLQRPQNTSLSLSLLKSTHIQRNEHFTYFTLVVKRKVIPVKGRGGL